MGKFTESALLVALGFGCGVVSDVEAGHHEVQVGVYTKHLTGDKDEKDGTQLNETNNLISYKYHRYIIDTGWHMTYSVGDFTNSHNVPANYVGVGYSRMAFNGSGSYGVDVLAVDGYEDHLQTMYMGLVFLPVPSIRYGYAALSLFGPVVIGTVSVNF